MRIITLLIFLFCQICYSQTNADYVIYSKILNNTIENWKFDSNKKTFIVITDYVTTFSQRINFKEYSEVFFGNNIQLAYMSLNYKDSLIKIREDQEFIDLFNQFSINCYDSIHLSSIYFNIKPIVKVVEKNEIELLFSKSNNNSVKQSWKKFYKRYPESLGYFEFSKVEYSENFSVVYFVHRAKPLIGGGQLIVLKKYNNTWNIYESLNLWME